MLPRVVGIPAAVVVLVGAPPLIARIQGLAPEAPTAALKIHVTGDAGSGTTHPLYVRLSTAGQPPVASSRLVDDEGLHPATVSAVPTDKCAREPLRLTGKGSREWCLSVTHVAAGHELTGVANGGTTLTLSVTRRNSFWGLPLVFLLLGFATALLLPAASRRLRRFVGQLPVAGILDANSHAGADSIADLDEWVKGRVAAGASMGDLLPTLSKIVPDGPPKIRAARKRLAAALGRITLPVASDYVQHAATEAAHTEVVAADLLDNDGAVRSTARAEEWRVGLEQLDADQRFLDDEERMIGDHLQPRCRSRPTRALHTARGYLATIETPENVAGMKDHIVLVKTAYNAARDDPACRLLEIPETDREVTMALKAFVVCSTGAGRAAELSGAIEQAVREGVVEPLIAEVHELVPDPLDLKGERLQHAFDLGKLLTAVAILVVLAFAGATVWDAAYEPKPAFADFSDYFTLYSAALASGAAAAVLGVLAYWRPAPATSPG